MAQNVEFEEDSFSYAKPQASGSAGGLGQSLDGEPSMVRFLVRNGLVKTVRAGHRILVAIVIINIIITFIVISYLL